jgi:UDP-N-acetylmuramoyl-tripeptide--D-alanyl-D-alanine ligase
VAVVGGGERADPDDGRGAVTRVTIDSRQAGAGSLFVPLRGEHVDGHDYVSDAVVRGAEGYLWEARRPEPPAPSRAIVVDDPADALLGLGAWMRQTVAPTVIAITGSSGKTTTKDFIAAAVGTERRVVANPGSYNNEIGVPLTCCLLEEDTEVLVAEIGARGIGHIAMLAPLIAPDIAVVTLVAAAHLEMLGSEETVARAKAELVESLVERGGAIRNADAPRVAGMAGVAPGRVVTYALDAEATWRADDLSFDELGRARFTARGVPVRLPVPGRHNAANALAALAAADAVGVPAERAAAGLESAAVSRWRMQLVRTPSGVTVLNDAYNANPASMEAALRTLAAVTVSGRRWAVLGYMAELGAVEREAHERVGQLCAHLGIDGLVTVGEQASLMAEAARLAGFAGADGVRTVAGVEEAAAAVADNLGPGDTVLVKASRAIGLERVVDLLAEAGVEEGRR